MINMKKVIIDKTPNTPYFEFDPDNGLLKIEGRSIPENPSDFYEKILTLVDEYYTNPQKKTRFDLNLEYINSGSSKFILGLFRKLKKYYDQGNDLVINWYYEEDDEAVLGLGEHYKSTIKLPFNLIEYI